MSDVSYRVRHATLYRYGQSVSLSHHLAHLLPRNTPTQWVSAYRLDITPPPAGRREEVDYFGNPFVYFSYETPHGEMTVETELQVTVAERPVVEPDATPDWRVLATQLQNPPAAAIEASEFRFNSALIAAGSASAFLPSCGRPAACRRAAPACRNSRRHSPPSARRPLVR